MTKFFMCVSCFVYFFFWLVCSLGDFVVAVGWLVGFFFCVCVLVLFRCFLFARDFLLGGALAFFFFFLLFVWGCFGFFCNRMAITEEHTISYR